MSTAWEIKEALEFIRTLQPITMAAGYYIALAGRVLNKGYSDNDLDLVAVPRTKKSIQDNLLSALVPYLKVSRVHEDEVVSVTHIQAETWETPKSVEISIVKVL